jgi:hypothetical protein
MGNGGVIERTADELAPRARESRSDARVGRARRAREAADVVREGEACPVGRIAKPADVAKAYTFLLGSELLYIFSHFTNANDISWRHRSRRGRIARSRSHETYGTRPPSEARDHIGRASSRRY